MNDYPARKLCLLGLILFVTSPLGAKTRFEQWLDEVHWIASRAELQAFEKLQSDEDKLAFIEEFWVRRDPTPYTDQNEYKDEHYRRWEYVNKRFREGIPGWRGDRGRVYIVHGPPQHEEFRDVPTIGNPGTRRKRQSIVWTYFEMPNSKFFRGRMVLVFQANVGLTEQDMTLGESRVALEKAQQLYNRMGVRPSDIVETVRFRLVAAGPPTSLTGRGGDIPSSGVGEYARFVEDIFRSPGELLEQKESRRSESRNALQQKITSRVSFTQIPLHMICSAFYGNEDARLTVAWQFPIGSLDFRKESGIHFAEIDLMAQVRDDRGQVIDEFFKTLQLAYTKEDFEAARREDFRYLNEFHLPTGSFVVSSLARDMSSEKLGSAEQSVELHPIESGELLLSGVVLSRGVSGSDGSSIGSDLVVEEKWRVMPEPDAQFSSSERMVIFFKVYNAQAHLGTPHILVSYDFLSESGLVRKGGPRTLQAYTDPGNKSIEFSSVVDLSGMVPGEYKIQVNVIDLNTKQYVIDRQVLRIG